MNARRVVAPLVVAAAVAGGAIGGAVIGIPGLSGAQTGSSTTTTTQPGHGAKRVAGNAELDAAAKALGLTTAQLVQKLSDGKTTIADVASQQHVDLQQVVDAMEAASNSRINDLVHKPWPKFNRGNGNANGKRPSFAGPGSFGVGLGLGADADAIAGALKITTDQLKSELLAGKSIAAIAKEHGVDVNTLINTLVNDAKSKIDDAVKAGKLTQQQATNLENMLKQRITNAVNGTSAGGAFGRFHGRRAFPGGSPGGPPTSNANSQPSAATSSV